MTLRNTGPAPITSAKTYMRRSGPVLRSTRDGGASALVDRTTALVPVVTLQRRARYACSRVRARTPHLASRCVRRHPELRRLHQAAHCGSYTLVALVDLNGADLLLDADSRHGRRRRARSRRHPPRRRTRGYVPVRARCLPRTTLREPITITLPGEKPAAIVAGSRRSAPTRSHSTSTILPRQSVRPVRLCGCRHGCSVTRPRLEGSTTPGGPFAHIDQLRPRTGAHDRPGRRWDRRLRAALAGVRAASRSRPRSTPTRTWAARAPPGRLHPEPNSDTSVDGAGDVMAGPSSSARALCTTLRRDDLLIAQPSPIRPRWCGARSRNETRRLHPVLRWRTCA